MHSQSVHNKSQAFPKRQRLLKPAEFKHVFEHQKKLYCKGVVVYYLDNKLGYSRLGLVVAKKHFKRANTRNRIKRQVREYFRRHQETLGKAHKDLVIVATAKLVESKSCPISPLLDIVWKRLSE